MEQTEQDPILTQISQELSEASLPCSSLTRLNGGTANFVYRGIRLDDNKSIIIKHTKDYVASHPEFKIPTSRCLYEETMLKALSSLASVNHNVAVVKTPHLLYFNKDTSTQVLEDLPNSLDLKSYMLSPVAAASVDRSTAVDLGRALGSWLRLFHAWASEPGQADLREEIKKNEDMRRLKFHVNYANLVDMIDQYPGVLGDSRDILEKVHGRAKLELEVEEEEEEEEGGGLVDGSFGVIHGDFWTGNVLIPNYPLNRESKNTLFVIDWELSQIGSRALDLGQMIAELYQLKHFKDIDAGPWIIQGLMEGYGSLGDELAFRTAIHVGTHLICWGSTVPGWGTQKQVEGVVRIGRDFIVKGWEKDREWFERGSLGCLFGK